MTCPSCGLENSAGRKFCGNCGHPLAILCPTCGSPNEPGVRYCGECGSELAPETPAVAPSELRPAVTTAERRLVSVLFADLVGFTSLSEGRDPEEVRDLLSRYFDTCRSLISRYGGTVEKFIGDAVMAVWGTPVAKEDDAERAVRSALDLVAAVQAMGVESGAAELRARAGVLTGEAAVTLGTTTEGMVAGDLVNTASRLQSVAPPGQVYVGETTRRATEAAIVYEDAGLHELKGKAEPVRLHQALRVVASRGGALRRSGLEPPFVGRDRELRLIKELFHTSAEQRRAHLVSVIGVGGIGKSRLAWEFEKYVDGVTETIRWHRGRCLSYGEGVTYWALAEMLRSRAGIVEGESQQEALRKLHRTVEEFVADPEERQWVEPRLANLLGLEERSAPDQQDLFSAWRLFFERMADRNPTVLVFEDMEWADAALVEFIDYLLNWSRNYPLFLLVLARPEFAERHQGWGGGKRGYTPLYLEPLPDPAIDELLSGLVPDMPEHLMARIDERAEGVPLYAVETLRRLVDRGLLVLEGNAYRLTAPVDDLEVPETLQALIAARLDGLSSEERALIQRASVLGKTFAKPALAAVSGATEPELEPLLVSLVRKEILFVQADPRSPERGQYGFIQDLVRKIAYDTQPRRERKARHLAAAAHLESVWGQDEDEIVEILAAHYLDAFRAAPDAPDAPEIQAKAAGRLARAGERAASLAATAEAQRYFEQAIEFTPAPVAQAELHERAGVVAWRGGRVDRAAAHYEQAVSLFESQGLTHPSARVAARLAEIDWASGQPEQAVARLEPAFEVLSRDEPDADLATVAGQLGRFLALSQHTERAIELLELALHLAGTLDLPDVLSHALSSRAIVLIKESRLAEAKIILRGAIEVALESEVLPAALRAYNNLMVVTESLDLYGEAVELSEESLQLTRRVGDRVREAQTVSGTLGDLIYVGRWDEALAQAEEVQRIEVGSVRIQLVGLLDVIHVLVNRGDVAEARRHFEAMPWLSESDDVQIQCNRLFIEAELLRAEGRTAEALGAAERVLSARPALSVTDYRIKRGIVEVLEACLELGRLDRTEELLAEVEGLRPGEMTPFLRANAARFRARLAIARGEEAGVESGFKSAAGLFRELSAPFWLAMAQLEHAEWLAGRGRVDAAEPLLVEAGATFERLGAAPWLDRLARLTPEAVRSQA
jgi:class 3 adenylate cyclase/tetratricopeptide (TPR) repeat protein